VPRQSRDEIRADFVAIAARHFAETGYQATSLEGIAHEAGYSKAALLYHFGSKEDLLLAVVAERLDEVDRLLGEFETQPPGPDRTRAALAALATAVLERRPVGPLALSPPHELSAALASHPELVERALAVRERLLTLLAGPSPTLAQRLRLSMTFYGLPPALHEFADIATDELHDLLTDVLADAITPPTKDLP
jgi:AcrR family transcriptional regulator